MTTTLRTTAVQLPWMAWIADAAIAFYQRYLSPWKGFRCALRALHPRRDSCSQYARRVLQRRGFWGGLAPLLQRRFKRCGESARLLREQRVLDYERKKEKTREAEERDASKHDWEADCLHGCDVGTPDCSALPCDAGDFAPSSCDAPGIDACPCDGCDFSP